MKHASLNMTDKVPQYGSAAQGVQFIAFDNPPGAYLSCDWWRLRQFKPGKMRSPDGSARSGGLRRNPARPPGHVFSIAYHFLHDRALAEELAQEVFLCTSIGICGYSIVLTPGLLAAQGGHASLHRSSAAAETAAAPESDRVSGACAGAAGIRPTADPLWQECWPS